jgi:membrane associated rhomboid family serine protease
MFGQRILVDPNTKIVRLGGRPPQATMALLISQLVFFLAMAFADGTAWIGKHFALSADGLFYSGKIWQPVTAVLFHFGVRSAILDMLSLWLFGSALERWWGTKRFLIFYFATGIGGLVVGGLFGLLAPKVMLSGPIGSAMGMLVATAVIFSDHLMHIYRLTPFKAKLICLITAGSVVLGSLISRLWLVLAVQLTGAVIAVGFLSPRRMLNEWRARRLKKKFTVVRGGKDDPHYLN